VKEVQRAVQDLGLSGVKLMIHQAGSTRIDAKLELGRPALLDDIGREFRDLRIIIAHCGISWVDEALFLLTKQPNFFADLSYLIATFDAPRLVSVALSLRTCIRPSREALLRDRLSGISL
jgi:predicted TIM-barrel fold metal-dependent hydrolase